MGARPAALTESTLILCQGKKYRKPLTVLFYHYTVNFYLLKMQREGAALSSSPSFTLACQSSLVKMLLVFEEFVKTKTTCHYFE